MSTCCACGYSHDKISGQWWKTSLHSFPQDEKIRQKWIEAIGQNMPVTKNTRLCSWHFTPDCLRPSIINSRKKVLKSNVVPSLFGFDYKSKLLEIQEAEAGETPNEEENLDCIEIISPEKASPSSQSISLLSISEGVSTKAEHTAFNTEKNTILTIDESPHLIDHDYVSQPQVINATTSPQASPLSPININSASCTPEKRENIEDTRPVKRIKNFRYIGDCTAQDIQKSPWKAEPYVYWSNKNLKIKSLTRKVAVLQKKLKTLKDMIAELKEVGLISDAAQQVLESACVNIDKKSEKNPRQKKKITSTDIRSIK